VALGWRIQLLVLLLTPALAGAERPPPKGQPTAFASSGDGGTRTAGANYLAALPEAARKTLEKEGVVVLDQQAKEAGPAFLRAVVRFNRPIAQVYPLLSHPAEQSKFLPHVDQSTTFGGRTDEGEAVDYKVVWLFSFEHRTQHWFYPELNRVEWTLLPKPGDSLKEQQGSWQLYEVDDQHSLAQYDTRLVSKGALLEFLRGLGERGAVKDSLNAVRKHVESAPVAP
jgi:hypothetical protein